MDELRDNVRHPWHDDHPLSVAEVRAILTADGIDLPLRVVEPHGSGWDFNTFLVDSQWLFRFPKRAECMHYFRQELAALAGLNEAIDQTLVRFPEYRFTVTDSARFPLAYGGYRLVPGEPLQRFEVDALDLDACAAQLGQFLACVHACEPFPAPVRCPDPFPGYLIDIRQELDRVGPVLGPDLRDACVRLVATPYPVWDGVARFRHADLGAEHLLVDPDTGTFSGVIDWGDAGWGDPLLDFVGWWIWTGDAPTAAAMAHYGVVPDPDTWARIRYRGACAAISEAHYGHASGRRDVFDRSVRILQRIHAAGQLHDPYRSDPGRTMN